MSQPRSIHIQGARTHNLKNIDCEIPHGSFTVVTGPSGSGKSSLAFDTLYAEGQRRFLESMSTYARQFLERIEKPDVEQIQNILPAIALKQKNQIRNARSTVGSATEIYDFLRLLFAAIGTTICDRCGGIAQKATPQSIEAELCSQPPGTRLILTAPVSLNDFPLKTLLAQGYFRALVKGEAIDLNQIQPENLPEDPLELIIDRLVLQGEKTSSRLLESIRKVLEMNPRQVNAHLSGQEIDSALSYPTRFACRQCHHTFAEPFPNLFSFNNPLGACEACEGFGKIIGLDLDKVIPNKKLSLAEGAIHPFNTPSNQDLYEALMSEGQQQGIRLDTPFEALSVQEKMFVLEGSKRYPGVHGFFKWLESKKYKMHVRVMLAKYRGYYPCPECQGSRLQPEALRVRIEGRNIHELCELSIAELIQFFETLHFSPEQRQMTHRLVREIMARLKYLQEIGLGYLTLSRQSRTLSGGEAQRIHLASALGSTLTDTLYVLDEPTVGLHARDTQRLLSVLKALRDYGNTVVVVEHDPEMIAGADRIIDLGPTGGQEGGHIVYEGDIAGFLKTDYSPTACFLNTPPSIETNSAPKKANAWMEIRGASGNNLKQLDVRFPRNQLVCVSGVSGSGKSTLIKQTLYANYQQARGQELTLDPTPCKELKGFEIFKDVILVDQTPPGRSARSNPVTYVKAYDEIRKLFASTRKAQALGATASHFSFNLPGGRCETCEGLGTITIDMQFMADVTMICHDCQGKRFSPLVLAIEIDGKTIHQVLDLTVTEAIEFFHRHPRIIKRLLPLAEIGLGYLKLGQSTSTLSGGEAQRLKLAAYLLSSSNDSAQEPYLFLFDEPTTGLHLTDIHTLILALRKLLVAGHSAIVVEHNIELLAYADYIIDLGPEGGSDGGAIVAEGPPEAIMACPQSFTGEFLRQRYASVSQCRPVSLPVE